MFEVDKIYCMDCLEGLKQIKDNTINLVIADPPYYKINFDPCPYPRPEGFDGLKVPWGFSNYVNPPFEGGVTAWVRKAIKEYQKGKKVVFVFPIDKWIHFFIENGAEIRNLKDIKWHSIEDNKPGPGTGRWIACFVLDPRKLSHRQKELELLVEK